MPLTEKGEEIKGAMKEEYGEKKGEEVFYASRNKGTISGVDAIVADNFNSEKMGEAHRAGAVVTHDCEQLPLDFGAVLPIQDEVLNWASGNREFAPGGEGDVRGPSTLTGAVSGVDAITNWEGK